MSSGGKVPRSLTKAANGLDGPGGMAYICARLFSRTANARVAELVDALDLGSSGLCPWGFESPLSHQRPCRISPGIRHFSFINPA